MVHEKKECRLEQGHAVCGMCAVEDALSLYMALARYKASGKSERLLVIREFTSHLLDIARQWALADEVAAANTTVDGILSNIGKGDTKP